MYRNTVGLFNSRPAWLDTPSSCSESPGAGSSRSPVGLYKSQVCSPRPVLYINSWMSSRGGRLGDWDLDSSRVLSSVLPRDEMFTTHLVLNCTTREWERDGLVVASPLEIREPSIPYAECLYLVFTHTGNFRT